MIEMLHAAETIKDLLHDDDMLGDDLMRHRRARAREGVGVIEAPRGTLIHHYRVDENDLVTHVQPDRLDHAQQPGDERGDPRGRAALSATGSEITEGLLNHIEVAIRAFDPCLSCATHALGKMPLAVELVDAQGQVLDVLRRDDDGVMHEPCGA